MKLAKNVNNNTIEQSEFYTRFRGCFTGILRWPQLDEFWQVLTNKAGENWYIYAVGEAVPEQVSSADEVVIFIAEMNKLLRKEHQEDYCGVVYVSDKEAPDFIKIYDPNNLGVSCGSSDTPTLPGWILSKLKPELLDEKTFITQSRKRWWRRLFLKD
ncbi:hypothetical protein MNBD_GAMMA12-1575 [hydrothermal vent metagenome]|uniref:Uncharacterized protein n=1 Tax=hydrothermal vent metagenome TaxID=652676 RepID=A0A3B0YJM1_9ZZZZ